MIGIQCVPSNLSWADLRRAILRGTNLSGVNLRGANLSEANLSGARRNAEDPPIAGWELVGERLVREAA